MSIGVTERCGPLDEFRGVEIHDGVAYVPVAGLIARTPSIVWRSDSGERWCPTGTVASVLSACQDDPRIRAVVAVFDSPGGEVAGIPAVVRQMRELSETKLTVAYVNERCASAAYWIATGCSQIWCASAISQLGSIGTLVTLTDTSKQLDAEGVRKIHVTDADRKAWTLPGVAIGDEAVAAARDDIARCSAPFIADVCSARGLAESDVRALNGAYIRSVEAIEKGLADAVVEPMDLHAAVAAAAESLDRMLADRGLPASHTFSPAMAG